MPGSAASKRIVALLLLVLLAALGAAAWVFQDAVGRWMINPNRTYEAYTPPPAPDYGQESAWLVRGVGEGPADVFFIHSTVYHGDGNWNAPFDRDTQLPFLKDVLLPLESGPFARQGPLWAPRFRQPTLYARFTQKHAGAASRDTAYDDVLAAFEIFLAERDPAKPFIVAGYDDGALFAGKLWRERIEPDAELLKTTVAVYAIGLPLPARMFEDDVCGGEAEARCMLGFVPVDARFEDYQQRLRERTLTLGADGGWVSTSRVAELCAPPPIRSPLRAALAPEGEVLLLKTDLRWRCENGLMIVEPPADRRLRNFRFFGRQWRPDRVNLFYEPLAQDAARRTAGALTVLAREANTAPPLAAPEEVRESEINKVPEYQ